MNLKRWTILILSFFWISSIIIGKYGEYSKEYAKESTEYEKAEIQSQLCRNNETVKNSFDDACKKAEHIIRQYPRITAITTVISRFNYQVDLYLNNIFASWTFFILLFIILVSIVYCCCIRIEKNRKNNSSHFHFSSKNPSSFPDYRIETLDENNENSNTGIIQSFKPKSFSFLGFLPNSLKKRTYKADSSDDDT